MCMEFEVLSWLLCNFMGKWELCFQMGNTWSLLNLIFHLFHWTRRIQYPMWFLPLGALVSNSAQSLRLYSCLVLISRSTPEAGELGDFPGSSQSELEVSYVEETKRFKSRVILGCAKLAKHAKPGITRGDHVFLRFLVCLPRYLEGHSELEQLCSFRNISGFHMTWWGWLFAETLSCLSPLMVHGLKWILELHLWWLWNLCAASSQIIL